MLGTVTQDYNLFAGNTAAIFGSIPGGLHNATGDPRFLNPAGDDYHLGPGSAAVNAGTDLGLYVDYDGDPRPSGSGFDLGYDESPFGFLLSLPLVLR